MESPARPVPTPLEAPPQAPGGPGASRAALVAALLAGVTALTAETVWIRALGRAVGTTTESLAAITAVFLGGLGLGSAWGGRLAGRCAFAGRAAGRCLLGAAVLVLVSPWLFVSLPSAHLWLLDLLGQEPGPSPWPALCLALPLLLAPTFLMGASFPLLLAARASGAERVGRGSGGLYALNTLGAALGTALSVLLLPHLGERLTLTAAAALEIVAGAALLLAAPDDGGAGRASTQGSRQRMPLGPCVVLALTGLTGMGVEVAAFRLLEPITGPHLWGVALLLVPVLLGLALGGWVGGSVADRVARPSVALASTLALAGTFVVALLWTSGRIPWWVAAQAADGGGTRLAMLATGVALALLPPLAVFGAAFPLGVRWAAQRGVVPARAAGALSAWNAAGAVLGSLLVGFAVLPRLGALVTLLLLAALVAAAGVLLRLAAPGRRVALPAVATGLPVLALAAAAFLPGARAALVAAAPSLPEVVALGRQTGPAATLPHLATRNDMRLYAEWYGGRPAQLPGGAPGETVPAREGRLGTVALLEEPGGAVRLRVNGLSEARFVPGDPDAGSVTEVALGLLPALAHPAPKRALVIGHGAGWTAEAVLATGPEHVDVAELDATVLDAVEAWRDAARTARDGGATAAQGLAVRRDPRARLWLTDGRLLLRRAAGGSVPRYDVIASQPSHPWVPGAGHLFTHEAYELARAALAEGGVFAQWLNLFEMSPDLLRQALATFRDVFPLCWLFLFDGEAVLLGFEREPALDPARWERLLAHDPAVRALASKAGFASPGDLWSRVVLDGAGLERFAPASRTRWVVDDRPELELGLALRVLGGDPVEDLEPLLRAGFPPDLARLLPDGKARERWNAGAIEALLLHGRPDLALAWDERVPYGTDPESLLVRAKVARVRGEVERAEAVLRGVIDGLAEADWALRGDWVAGWILLLSDGALQEPSLRARFLADAAPWVARLPDDGRVRAAFARLKDNVGDLRGARTEYVAALAADAPPAPTGTAAALARVLLTLVDEPDAEPVPRPDLVTDEHILELLRREPEGSRDRPTRELLARLEMRLGDVQRAGEEEAALAREDRRLSQEALDAGWLRLARGGSNVLEDAQRAVGLDPRSPRAWELLALATLQRAASAEDPVERDRRRADAVAALSQAWGHAEDPDQGGRRARSILSWFGLGDAGLVRAVPE